MSGAGVPPPVNRPCVFVRETGSTNTDIKRKIRAGGGPAPESLCADRQHAGRGRLGNRFFSPAGGVYFSAAFPLCEEDRAPAFLSLLAGLAAAETLERLCGARALIKWPNDLILNGKKLAGILCEYLPDLRIAVMGIGINAALPAEEIPPELRGVITSLSAEGFPCPDRETLIREIVAYCDREIYEHGALDGVHAAPLAEKINARAALTGRRVRRQTGAEKIEGVVSRIDPDGALVLQVEGGALRRITFGEAQVLPADQNSV